MRNEELFNRTRAPVAQRIEQSRPKGKMRVQFLPGAQVKFFILINMENFTRFAKKEFNRERGRGNGSFPVAERTNRWVRGSELLYSDERRSTTPPAASPPTPPSAKVSLSFALTLLYK